MDTIKFPVSFDSTGFKKLEAGTYEYYRQLLTIALLTEPGDNPLTPDFGVADPAFNGFDGGLFIYNAARFVPEIEVRDVSSSINDKTGKYSVKFTFDIREVADDAN